MRNESGGGMNVEFYYGIKTQLIESLSLQMVFIQIKSHLLNI